MDYRTDTLNILELHDVNQPMEIILSSDVEFKVKKNISGNFQASGFRFEAKKRLRTNSSYLATPLVDENYYIKGASEALGDDDINLRTGVDNAFGVKRFNDNDYLFIDKNRNGQIESGRFNNTRFDRLLDDFNYQYLKAKLPNVPDVNKGVASKVNIDKVKNDFLDKAFAAFKELTGYDVNFSFLYNYLPYQKAFLTYKDGLMPQLPVEKLGSGYQMLLALVCQFYLTQQSNKKLIVFIDEIELHLHHKIQKELAGVLLELSAKAQIIISTHSSEFLKDLAIASNKQRINVLKKRANGITINPVEEYVLPKATIAEANYVALEIPSMEYFNELYGYLVYICEDRGLGNVDDQLKNETTLIDWKKTDGTSVQLTIHTCIRHKIHHPENQLNDKNVKLAEQLPVSIKYLRQKILDIKNGT